MAQTRETQAGREQREEGRHLQRTQGGGVERHWRQDPYDVFGHPFSLMRRMQEDMDRLFGGLWGGRRQSFFEEGGAQWAPAIEAFQRGSEFVVRADVPGLDRDDLSVEVNDDSVSISGERKYDSQEEREGVYRSERGYGTFRRVVPLPEGALAESAKANFRNGVLEIVVQAPSRETRRGRRLEIGQEGGEKTR